MFKAILCEFINAAGDVKVVDTKEYERTTLAYERQVADDLAKEHNIRKGEGYVKIVDEVGDVVDILSLPY